MARVRCGLRMAASLWWLRSREWHQTVPFVSKCWIQRRMDRSEHPIISATSPEG